MYKFLVICAPFSGHTYPALPMMVELVQRGHTVISISSPRWKHKIEAAGVRCIPYRDFPAGLSELKELGHFFQAAFLTAISLHEKFDALIYDGFFYPGSILAERLGIKCIRMIFQPAWNRPAVKESRKSNRYRFLSYKATLSYRILDMLVMNRKTRNQLNIHNKNLTVSNLEDIADINIICVSEAFQPYREFFDERFLFSVPEFESGRRSDVKLPFETMKRPIIYASLGSMITSKRFIAKCIKAFGNKDLTFIISTGQIKPESLNHLPNNFYAYSFVPQLEVLQQADLFITHGGMNSVNEAMYYGVPMLVIPIINDQPVNAARIEELGIGKCIKPRIFKNTLYSKSMDILNNSEFKENALIMKGKVRNGIGSRGIADTVEQYLATFYGNS